jgi:hypothetical protein
MKNRNILRFVGILSLFAILFSSCSKDSLKSPFSQASKKNSTKNDPIPGTGSVQANLTSGTALRMSLVAINEDNGFVSAEVFTDQDGNVTIDNLQEGPYTIVAHAYIPFSDDTAPSDVVDVTITIPSVKILADQITDLGRIAFEQ